MSFLLVSLLCLYQGSTTSDSSTSLVFSLTYYWSRVQRGNTRDRMYISKYLLCWHMRKNGMHAQNHQSPLSEYNRYLLMAGSTWCTILYTSVNRECVAVISLLVPQGQEKLRNMKQSLRVYRETLIEFNNSNLPLNAQKQTVAYRPFCRACSSEISREDEGYMGRRITIETNACGKIQGMYLYGFWKLHSSWERSRTRLVEMYNHKSSKLHLKTGNTSFISMVQLLFMMSLKPSSCKTVQSYVVSTKCLGRCIKEMSAHSNFV